MALSQQDIAKIANLSKLSFTSEQAALMQEKLSGFFDIVAQMKAVNTTGIVPMAHPLDAMDAAIRLANQMKPIELRLRPDVASEPNNREANQQTAPAVERGLFLVPKVIE